MAHVGCHEERVLVLPSHTKAEAVRQVEWRGSRCRSVATDDKRYVLRNLVSQSSRCTEIQPVLLRETNRILQAEVELVGLQLSDPIARLIAEKIKTNIRHLEGTVNLIKAIAAYTNEQPTMAMTQRAIREMMVENQPAEITVDRVISDVAAMFKVSPEEIRSTNRRANVSLARKITIYVLKQVKNMTYQEIGDELGKNHSTMTLHYQDACNMLKENAQLKENVNEIINNLKEK